MTWWDTNSGPQELGKTLLPLCLASHEAGIAI